MGNSLFRGLALVALAATLFACNPQDLLGVGLVDPGTTTLPDGSVVGTGLNFTNGKISISKAATRDMYGSLGTKYCFDNTDTTYGCVKDGSGSPAFLRSIRFRFSNRSNMFGISPTEDLQVTVAAATVITAVPVLDPETGNFVFTKREKYRYDSADVNGVKVSSTDSSCVPGTNGAVGFDDTAGYALTGLHVFEEGIDYSTSMTGLWAAQVDLTYYLLNDTGGVMTPSSSESSASIAGLDTTSLPGATIVDPGDPTNSSIAPFELLLKTSDTYSPTAADLPRVITGFCVRSAKKSVANSLIRVGLFGVRGVFYQGSFH